MRRSCWRLAKTEGASEVRIRVARWLTSSVLCHGWKQSRQKALLIETFRLTAHIVSFQRTIQYMGGAKIFAVWGKVRQSQGHLEGVATRHPWQLPKGLQGAAGGRADGGFCPPVCSPLAQPMIQYNHKTNGIDRDIDPGKGGKGVDRPLPEKEILGRE